MVVTLRQLLTADIFRSSEVIAGEQGLDHKVSALNILDALSGYEYAKSDMLLIASRFFFALGTNKQVEMLERLAEIGVSGLALKPKYFGGTIPKDLCVKAAELKFPLIALMNDEAAYRDFFVFFDTCLYCHGIGGFVKREDLSSQLIRQIHTYSLLGLAKLLHKFSGCGLTILFDQECCFFPPEEGNTEFGQMVSDFSSRHHMMCSQRFPGLLEFRKGSGAQTAIQGLGTELTHKAQVIARIWLDCTRRPPDENDAAMLHAAALACELEVAQIMCYQQEEARLRAQLMEQLLSGQLRTWHETELLSKGLNWRFPMETRILVVTCEAEPAYCQQAEAALGQFFRSRMEQIIVYPYQKKLVVFVPLACARDLRFCREIQGVLAQRFPKIQFKLGLGRIVPLQNVFISYAQALYALRVGHLLYPEDFLFVFQSLGFYRLFCTEALPEELLLFCQDYLGPLIDWKGGESIELAKTLKLYFQFQGNISQVGKALFVQPNTVRYRLSVIENLCHISFKSSTDVLSMQLALHLSPLAFPESKVDPVN